jgi:hypothetical protein
MTLKKFIVALCMLAYSASADAKNKNYHLGKSMAI